MPRANKEGHPNLELDLTDPAQARRFLTGFHFANGNRIQYVVLADDTKVLLKDMTDRQAVSAAGQIYEIYRRNNGCYFEDVH